MIILGVDPGITNCGWGVVEKFGSQYKLLGSGCVVGKKDQEEREKLGVIFETLSKLVVQYKTGLLSVEQVFFAKNAATALKTSEVVGVCKLITNLQGIAFVGVTPLQVKMALTGYGRAEKFQVESMIKRFLNIKESVKPSHAADAVAIALTAGFIWRK